MMREMVKLLDDVYENDFKFESDYVYNGQIVPRVTKILSRCIHNDSLMFWANSLGFKHQSYKKTLKEAADIGTECHNCIDNFLESITNNTIFSEPRWQNYKARNAFRGFLKWFNDVSSSASMSIILHEHHLACRYFGGTLDGLYMINGKRYLVDYKTSNHVSFNYYLQLAAYRYMLRTEMGIEIDGCIILQLDKNSESYNEFILDFSNLAHLDFINHCERTFFSLVYSYYNLYVVEDFYQKIFGKGT